MIRKNEKDLAFYYEKARQEGWALGQFNFSSFEQLKGIVGAAVKVRSPLLVGTSEGDSGYIGMRQAVALVRAFREETGIPIFLNFDHGKSLRSIKAALEAGYDAVHRDASDLALKENIAETKAAVKLARTYKIAIVEGELGRIPGHSTVYHEAIVPSHDQFTDPAEAERFVKETGVDSFALTYGNVHGIYDQTPPLDMARLQEIKKRVECFLVLHGGSGIPDGEMTESIARGIVKINISTDLRLAFAQELRNQLAAHPDEITPYTLLPPVAGAVARVAEARMKLFGSHDKIEHL